MQTEAPFFENIEPRKAHCCESTRVAIQQALADFLNCMTTIQFATGAVDTGGKFAAGINNTSGTGGKIYRRRCHLYRCTLTCKYLPEFSRKFEMTQNLFSGAWGKMNHEKNLEAKNRSSSAAALADSAVRARTQDYVDLTLW